MGSIGPRISNICDKKIKIPEIMFYERGVFKTARMVIINMVAVAKHLQS